jgi:hypothetical protein
MSTQLHPALSDVSRTKKLLLGAATLWPLVYMLLSSGYLVMSAANVLGAHADPSLLAQPPSPVGAFVLFGLHCLTMLWTLVSLILYLGAVFRNPRLKDGQRLLWALALFFGNLVAMPVYWYWHIWREDLAPAPAT